MNKKMKAACVTAAMSLCMAVPAFAAETRAEFKTEAAPIREEIKSMREELQQYHTANKASSASFKALRTAKKNGGSNGVAKADWKKAKELKKQITAIHAEFKTSVNGKALRASVKADVKSHDFDAALSKLKDAADSKEKRLEAAKETRALWDQIDALLS